jgi:hypothetical protein
MVPAILNIAYEEDDMSASERHRIEAAIRRWDIWRDSDPNYERECSPRVNAGLSPQQIADRIRQHNQ